MRLLNMVSLKIENEAQMDNLLKELGKGIPISIKLAMNQNAMRPFKDVLKPKIEAHRTSDDDLKVPPHMADTLIIQKDKKTGKVSIGFSKPGKKAYIARFLNDGWDVKNQYGGPYKRVEGLHYWESTESESKEAVTEAMKESLEAYFNHLA